MVHISLSIIQNPVLKRGLEQCRRVFVYMSSQLNTVAYEFVVCIILIPISSENHNLTLKPHKTCQCFMGFIEVTAANDDEMTGKRFLHHWSFVRGIHWSPVDSHHKGPVIWRFGLSCDTSGNTLLVKQSNFRWFDTPVTLMWYGNEK